MPSQASTNASPRATLLLVRWVFTKTIIALVWLYRVTLGPFLGGHCRFHPTCSQYMLDAVASYGPFVGGWRGLKRIARCHPWGGSGIDHPLPPETPGSTDKPSEASRKHACK